MIDRAGGIVRSFDLGCNCFSCSCGRFHPFFLPPSLPPAPPSRHSYYRIPAFLVPLSFFFLFFLVSFAIFHSSFQLYTRLELAGLSVFVGGSDMLECCAG